MSSERSCSLYKKLLGLAGEQLNALKQERFDDALEYLEQRQKIIDEIQNLDEFVDPANRSTVKIHKEIEEILSIDREIHASIQRELTSISDQLNMVQRAKTFCNIATSGHKTGIISLTA